MYPPINITDSPCSKFLNGHLKKSKKKKTIKSRVFANGKIHFSIILNNKEEFLLLTTVIFKIRTTNINTRTHESYF